MSFRHSEFLPSARRQAAQPALHYSGLIKNFERVTLDMLRTASYEQMLEYGLQDMVDQHTALLLQATDQYGLFFYLKNALNSPYDLLLNCFPKNGHPLVHSVDELSTEMRAMVFAGINAGVLALVSEAIRQQDPLQKMYVIQHIGPGEADHHQPYSTTYAQMHWHMYGVPESMYGQGVVSPALHRDRSFKHTFWDPTVVVGYDLLKHLDPSIELERSTSAIILKKTNLQLEVTESDQALLAAVMQFWRKNWTEIARCFTAFELDDFGRYLPLDRDDRVKNVHGFITHHPELSATSQSILIGLAERLRPARAATEPSWNMIFKEMFGSIGYTHDFTTGQTTLRVAPRTFVTTTQIGATDGTFHTLKDRTKDLDPDKRDEIIAVQRKLLMSAKEQFQRSLARVEQT